MLDERNIQVLIWPDLTMLIAKRQPVVIDIAADPSNNIRVNQNFRRKDMSLAFRRIMIVLTTVLLAMALGACQSKKKSSDEGMDGGIDSAAMNFDPSGSDSGAIAGLYTINFDYDRATLTSEARAKLKENANWMKANSGVSVQIEGHCDMRGSIEYNLSLGERRAKAVKSYLVSLGVASDRLSVISYGKEKLLAMGDTEADHARNRRANFVPLAR